MLKGQMTNAIHNHVKDYTLFKMKASGFSMA